MVSKFEKAYQNIEDASRKQTIEKDGVLYILKRESKTKNTSIALRESTKNALDEISAEKGTSRNSLINDILEAYIKNYYSEG